MAFFFHPFLRGLILCQTVHNGKGLTVEINSFSTELVCLLDQEQVSVLPVSNCLLWETVLEGPEATTAAILLFSFG